MDRAVTGVVLCGGDGRRFGGLDKPLTGFDGRPLVAHLLGRLVGQVDEMLISANRSLDAYASFGVKVLPDETPGRGPLEGILAAARVAASDLLFVCPGDCPFLAEGIVAGLAAGMQDGVDVVVASDGARQQNLFMLLRRDCHAAIARYLDDGRRSVHGWIDGSASVVVPFGSPADYANVNTPDELAALEAGAPSAPTCRRMMEMDGGG